MSLEWRKGSWRCHCTIYSLVEQLSRRSIGGRVSNEMKMRMRECSYMSFSQWIKKWKQSRINKGENRWKSQKEIQNNLEHACFFHKNKKIKFFSSEFFWNYFFSVFFVATFFWNFFVWVRIVLLEGDWSIIKNKSIQTNVYFHFHCLSNTLWLSKY